MAQCGGQCHLRMECAAGVVLGMQVFVADFSTWTRASRVGTASTLPISIARATENRTHSRRSLVVSGVLTAAGRSCARCCGARTQRVAMFRTRVGVCVWGGVCVCVCVCPRARACVCMIELMSMH
jgi:hypothetical protein